ncbi:MAG TPA: MBL fold metallo-hydrolase [Candidatus Polarisedimenticolia bacterium]|nr:MBL fold metallo-hydrolase [Candidatus Polarisedimenticolia bacterium]
MKFKTAVTLLAFLDCATTALAAQPGPLETTVEGARAMLTREDLGDGVHVFRAPSDLDYWTGTNSTVIVDEDGVTVFDSGTRAVTARAVIAEIRTLTPRPVRVLVNSHWHQDHWSGNDEYAKAFPGLRIIASAETREFMSRMGPRFFVHEMEGFGMAERRAELAKAIRTGRLPDGSRLTPAIRARKEVSIATADQFEAEIMALPRVLPNQVYRGDMILVNGGREMRLMSMTGDATASTVLYLPGSRILVTGDVLVSPEDGQGPPPWTTNSYSVTPWLESLRTLERLDAVAIVPGQGPVMRDKGYLRRTIALFAAVISQVQAGLEGGLVTLKEVQAAVDVDRIGLDYAPGRPLPGEFHSWVASFAKKAMQEALDGAADVGKENQAGAAGGT